jgi:hypothetical protein
MTRPPAESRQRRPHSTARLPERERALARVLSQLIAALGRPSPLGLELVLERALNDAVRVSRGAADAQRGESPRWAALFNRLLDGVGDELAAALRRHPEVRHRDGRAAASVVVHAIEGLVRRSAELPNARARSVARNAVAQMLKIFLINDR